METISDSRPDRIRLSHFILDMGFGGSEKLVQDLAIASLAHGIFSNVICFDSVTSNTDPLVGNGIPIELIKRGPTAFDPRACTRVVHRLKTLKPDLIHAHDPASLAYAVAAGLLLRIPVVVTEHSRHYIEARRLRRLEKRLLCQFVSKLVEVSPELARASAERDGISRSKITVIENGVDLKRFADADRSLLRDELHLAPGQMLVGMIGRLEEIKGPQVLLEAFALVAGEIPEARLVFIGDGALAEPLDARRRALGLSKRVTFLGSRADIPSAMAALDVLVLPSLSEGLPFALLEGLAAGKAVLATAVGRVPGIIMGTGNEANGLLVNPGDAEGLAAKLLGLLRDEPLRRALGHRGRRLVEDRYDKSSMLAAYHAVYDQALAGRRRQCT